MKAILPHRLSQSLHTIPLLAILLAASLPASGFDRTSEASMRSSKGNSYFSFVELGMNHYRWDKPGQIRDDDRELLNEMVPGGMFSSTVEDTGIGISARVGGEVDMSNRFPSGDSILWLGWWLEVGSLPKFNVEERYNFQLVSGDQVQNARIDGNLELDGSLTYGVGFTTRWEWGANVKYSIGPYVSYDWYQIDRRAVSQLSLEQNGRFEVVDEIIETGDVDDGAIGYGIAVGVRFGEAPDRQPWYFRFLYGVNEVDEFDLNRISVSIYRQFGGYGHHVEGP